MAPNDSTPPEPRRPGAASEETAVLGADAGRHRADEADRTNPVGVHSPSGTDDPRPAPDVRTDDARTRTQEIPAARAGHPPTAVAAAASTHGAFPTQGSARETLAVQRDRFGGIKWGAAFFGWLSANGLAVLLLALLSAAGVGLGLANGVSSAAEAANRAVDQVRTVGVAGGVAVLVVLFLAYLAGGYVAGRMARFDGPRQGLAVWVIGLVVVVVLAGAGALLGAQYNVLKNLNLPRIPIDEGTATTAGIVTLVAMALITLLGALLGGALGTRYHRRIDRVALEA